MLQKAQDKKACKKAVAKIGLNDDNNEWEDNNVKDCNVNPIEDSPHCCMQHVLACAKSNWNDVKSSQLKNKSFDQTQNIHV